MPRTGFINIGFGSIVSVGKIVAVISPDSAPVKRIIQTAREAERLIDATYGRRTRAVVICDSEHVVLSAVQPETLLRRLDGRDAPEPQLDAEIDGDEDMEEA
ncbi:MAG: DUF370 domain-containing protein [Oscillospiraceae bacterium]|jgi:regulator of extracellular matrix RemA (YlzA/DUF370 family)|nr:DUF370 domain-containing protein [Oscillospiraceae bacterium]